METYARRRLERNVLSTLPTNEGRDDVVVLLDRAVGARREGHEGRHHDLRLLRSMGFKLLKLAPVATAYISAKHRSVPVVGKSFLGNKRDGLCAPARQFFGSIHTPSTRRSTSPGVNYHAIDATSISRHRRDVDVDG